MSEDNAQSGDQPASRSTVGYPARYADGKTAVIQEVWAQFGGESMHLVGRDGTEVASWGYDDIRLTEASTADRPIRLQSLSHGMARLDIPDHEALGILQRLAPDLNRTGMRDPAQWRRAAFWTLALVLVFGGIWWGVSRSAPLIAAMTPIEVEERIGKATVDQVSMIFGGFEGADQLTCRSRGGLRALNALTEQLAAVDDSPYEFKVRVLDISIPNAFAAPGGYIVIFRGLIDMAESPDEVAGVLAHEMGHVAHRHSMTHLIRSIGLQMLIVPLISGGSMAADVVSEMGQAALQASYTRELETDADRVAVELMNKAGLKAATFTDLLGRIEAEYGGKPDDGEAGAADDQDRKAESGSFSIPDMLATHPSTPDRTDMVHELASPGGEAGLNQSQWEALRSICDTRSNRN